MEEQPERRKEPRRKLMAFMPIYEQETGVMLGHTRDLTLQGILVASEKQLAVNTYSTLEFELPGGLPGISATRMAIPARVVRCETDESAQIYNVGFEFTTVEPEHSEILQALLERYRFRS
jgi:c-di-GMP-binding flagellar brake protein YcgR